MINTKSLLSLCCSSILILTLSSCADNHAENARAVQTVGNNATTIRQNPSFEDDAWYKDGQARLQEQLGRIPNNKAAKNVIIFIGDGLSLATVTAARIREGQLKGQTGEENALSFEHFPYSGLSKTYNTDSQTPDSAGTATAMLSGVKTKIGVVGLNDKVRNGDCTTEKESFVPTILEMAEDRGFSTGIISTARITHATPAATYAHSASRGWETEAPEGCTDIASQLLEFDHGDGIEVILGGGRSVFYPNTEFDPEYTDKKGHRKDGRNLIEEWKNKYPEGKYIWDDSQLNAINAFDGNILGLFERSHMQYEADRLQDKAGEPSLAAMTEFAVKRLKDKSKGFFLMVESGRIDHAHHASNAYRALHDTIALSDAVRKAEEMTNAEDTLIIVTADHGHVMEFAGYPSRGNPILGKAAYVDDKGERVLMKDANGNPYTTLGYLNGPGHVGESNQQKAGVKTYPHSPRSYSDAMERPDLTEVNTEDKNYLQESAFPASSETHSGTDVPVYAKGPAAHLLTGVYEQNYIFHVMQHALRLKE